MTAAERIELLAQKKAKLRNIQFKQRMCTSHEGVLRYADIIKELRQEIKQLEA